MEFVPYISMRKCSTCRNVSSCARADDNTHVCRACNPEHWERAAELEKDSWIQGGVEVSNG